MKAYFCVAEQTFSIELVGSTANVLMILPNMAPFACNAPTHPVLFSVAVHRGAAESDPHRWSEIGLYEGADIAHRVETDAEGGYRITLIGENDLQLGTLISDARFTDCHLYLDCPSIHHTNSIENALMLAFAFAGAHQGVLLMHASVPMIGNKGYVFQGKSGTGKSTHSRLWLSTYWEAHLLNDDNPAVRYDAKTSKAYVYGTPWSGKTPCYRNLRCEVGGFLRLHQAPHNRIVRQSPVAAFGSIISSCSSMIWDQPLYTAICDTINNIVACTPSYDLECLPNREAAELSHDTMTAVR
jgi:hypothetical protein